MRGTGLNPKRRNADTTPMVGSLTVTRLTVVVLLGVLAVTMTMIRLSIEGVDVSSSSSQEARSGSPGAAAHMRHTGRLHQVARTSVRAE